MSDIMAQIDDLDHEIEDLRDQLRSSRQQVADMARELEPMQERIIILRYVDGLKWDDVARAVHRSARTVHRIHKDTVDKLKEYKI